jgi:hypothetical protein
MKKIILLCAGCLVAVAVTVASASQVGSEGQVASFEAKLNPGSLPRAHAAPVQIRLQGEFKASPENHLAQLSSLEIAVNRHGKLITKGLPTCRVSQIEAASTQTALDVCGGALMGHGAITSTTAFPEQARGHFKATVLAFNGRRAGGGTQIFLHIHGLAPGPFTFILPIEVRRTQGTFGTVFLADMPGFARRWAYLTKFRFVIGRRYSAGGETQSVLRASCPAPKGLNGAIFPFARATYHFVTTKTLRATLVGGCRVRSE